MSPTALDVPGHHDSFALPANDVKVHSSAKRSPEGGLITVESDDVVYEGGEIRAKYTDRGAHVTSKFRSRSIADRQRMPMESCMSKRPRSTMIS